MKRWSALLLLLLLPLTMAPRTSVGSETYTVHGFTGQSVVRLGAAVPLRVEAVNETTGDFEADEFTFDVFMQGDETVTKDAYSWVKLAEGCALGEGTEITKITCEVPALGAGDGASYHFVARPAAVGALMLQLDPSEEDKSLAVAVIPPGRPRR